MLFLHISIVFRLTCDTKYTHLFVNVSRVLEDIFSTVKVKIYFTDYVVEVFCSCFVDFITQDW